MHVAHARVLVLVVYVLCDPVIMQCCYTDPDNEKQLTCLNETSLFTAYIQVYIVYIAFSLVTL